MIYNKKKEVLMAKKDKKSALEEMFEMFGINEILKFLEGKPEFIRKVSEMGRQKKESRLVINMPEWLKIVLQEKAKQDGMSMNEIVRVAVIEYLSKEKKK